MRNNLLFDFNVNKSNNTIEVKRTFAADLSSVWQAWTNPELLDQWWAPKPYKTETKSMNFTNGGTWLYSMVSPEGARHWCKADYTTITPLESYNALDAFCDENGNIDTSFARSLWKNTFRATGDTTLVEIVIQYDSLENIEKIIALGFKEGFTMAMGNLDEIFAQSKSK